MSDTYRDQAVVELNAVAAAGMERQFWAARLPISFLLLALLLAGTALRGPLSAALPNDPPTPKVAPPPRQAESANVDKPEQSETIVCRGRVLGPGDKPVAGARIALRTREGPDKELSVRGTTDKEGKFHFTIKRSELEADAYFGPWFALIATAEGHAPDWNYVQNPAGKVERVGSVPP